MIPFKDNPAIWWFIVMCSVITAMGSFHVIESLYGVSGSKAVAGTLMFLFGFAYGTLFGMTVMKDQFDSF